ncbi:MAG: class I SAM-dependent methyltransferase [Gemmataceae bacterium]|nr:class I SAM-dependent methyltransferase [Gemmataceae bacterium]
MSIQTIHHAYNDVVASHYDLDPQSVIGSSLDRAVDQLQKQGLLGDGTEPLKVLDVGMGTGLFLAKLRALGGDRLQPFGLDLAEKMVESARRKLPDLIADVGDAADLDAHFPGQSFACISTHFLTGFVPMRVLAPKIWGRLEEGGYWSLVGGTKAGYPALRAKAESQFLRWLAGAGSQKIDDVFVNPADLGEVVRTLEAHGFELCEGETFEPKLDFRNFNDFLDYAYRGGWLTPAIEALGLHRAGFLKRWAINRLIFPLKDHHSIAIALARKVSK